MTRVFTGISDLFTPARRLGDAAMVVEEGVVSWIGPRKELPLSYREQPHQHLGDRGVLPGLVDSHTHLVWAGDRLEEYRLRACGARYEEILEAGGGIYHTVEATSRASSETLLELAEQRAEIFLRGGVTTLEIKSGYGLETAQELRILEVVRALNRRIPQRVVPTLLAHVIPKGWRRQAYLEMFTTELIPEVRRRGLAEAVDVFCDRGAFELQASRSIMESARHHGLSVKAHAEQLERLGASQLVAELGGLSADHLEQTNEQDWRALARAGSVATLLPGATLILGKSLPDARGMLAAGVKLAVASDHNPGSSPLFSLFLALQLAIVLAGLSVEEALMAGTRHAALALGKPELGNLEPGSAADFLVIDGRNATLPLYTWGQLPLRQVFIAGECVCSLA